MEYITQNNRRSEDDDLLFVPAMSRIPADLFILKATASWTA